MLSIPLYFLLIIYLIILAIILGFFLVNFLHIVLTGTTTTASFVITLFVLICSALILYGTVYFLNGVDWSQQVILWNSSWLSSIFNA